MRPPELAALIRQLLLAPRNAAEQSRSATRFDVVLNVLADALATHPAKLVRVLDLGIGSGALPGWIVKTFGDSARRIAYTAVDDNRANVESLRGDRDLSKALARVEGVLGDLCELRGIPDGSFEVIVLANVLHEIDPHRYGNLFARLNALLAPSGVLLVIDMERLLDAEPEALAITWTAAELNEFLTCAGFGPRVTRHVKLTPVVIARMGKTVVSEEDLLVSLKRLLLLKAIGSGDGNHRLPAAPDTSLEDLFQILVKLSSEARLLSQLRELGLLHDMLDRLPPGHGCSGAK